MRNIQNHDVKIFTDSIETTAIEQIERLLTIPAFGGCKIRVMLMFMQGQVVSLALQVTWETRLSIIS